IENLLVRVDKFLFPVDFVVLDMDESFKTPMILGRPFLATTRALIDVEQRELILKVRKERVALKMNGETLKIIFSSEHEVTASAQPMVSLVEETKSGVSKILPQDTLNKSRVILEDNPTVSPDIQTKTQTEGSQGQSKILDKGATSISEKPRKEIGRSKVPRNQVQSTKWLPINKEKPAHILQQKQEFSEPKKGRHNRIIDPG